mgnify:FL=1
MRNIKILGIIEKKSDIPQDLKEKAQTVLTKVNAKQYRGVANSA